MFTLVTNMENTVAGRLEALRAERGWSYRQLEARSGVSYSHLLLIEKGRRSPGIDAVMKIASAFGMTTSEFMGEAEAELAELTDADMIEVMARRRGIAPGLMKDWIEAFDAIPPDYQETELEGVRAKTRSWRKKRGRLNEERAAYTTDTEEG